MTLAATVPSDSLVDQSRPQLTVRPAPRREPPYDDELGATHAVASPFDQPLPFAVPVLPALETGPRYDADLPDPSAWARRLLIGLSEAAAGRRAMHQLSDFLTPSISYGISGELHRARTGGGAHWLRSATVRSVRTMQPRAGIAEVSATLHVGRRVRAVALRVERRHHQWRCTRIVLG